MKRNVDPQTCELVEEFNRQLRESSQRQQSTLALLLAARVLQDVGAPRQSGRTYPHALRQASKWICERLPMPRGRVSQEHSPRKPPVIIVETTAIDPTKRVFVPTDIHTPDKEQ